MRGLVIAIVAMVLCAGSAATQDAASGEMIFKRCAGCHQIGPGAKNRTGPILTGVVGRNAGSIDGFNCSKSMTEAGQKGLVWTADMIFAYIKDPTAFLNSYLSDNKAKARMKFRLPGSQDRLDVIAHLGTF